MVACGFSKKLLGALACQIDDKRLHIKSIHIGDEHTIIEGVLQCTSGEHSYEIQSGILDLLKYQVSLDEVKSAEVSARDEAAEHYDKRLASRHKKEVPSTLKYLQPISGKRLVEYGCGTGRLTVELQDCDLILAIDFSRNSLEILSRKMSGKNNIGLAIADATSLKTARNYFERALSAELLEHIPTRNERQGFLKNVKDSLLDQGVFVCTAYYFDLRRRMRKHPQDGKHPSGISYHYFSRSGIRNEFKKVFEIDKTRIIDIRLPLQARLGLSKKLGTVISRYAEHIPLLREFGHLILIKARKHETE